jgi:hypothetical protein
MTQEELEKIKKDLISLEEELESHVEAYKADGKITKEEKISLKNTKKVIRGLKKN